MGKNSSLVLLRSTSLALNSTFSNSALSVTKVALTDLVGFLLGCLLAMCRRLLVAAAVGD